MLPYLVRLGIRSELVLLQGLQDCRDALGTLVMTCQIMPSRRGHRIGELSFCHVSGLPSSLWPKASKLGLCKCLLMGPMTTEAQQKSTLWMPYRCVTPVIYTDYGRERSSSATYLAVTYDDL